MSSYLSKLEISMITRLADKIFKMSCTEIISKDDIKEGLEQLCIAESKLEICLALEIIHYCYSVILSEVRQKKREILTIIFKEKPKLADEKSVLEKKLDAEPEYAKYKEQEEYLFQFLEHIDNIRNNINWLIKEEENL